MIWRLKDKTIFALKRSVLLLAGLYLSVNATITFAFTPLEEQVRQLYRNLTSPFGNNITAYVGQSSVPLPATSVPCIGCHGRDGVGRPEGGLIPSNITWNNLSKVYGGKSASGRQFPAYTEKSLYIALTKGLDPAGNKLDPGMPRFDVSMREVRALIAYLEHIDEEQDPGVFEDRLVVATVQPDNALGKVVSATLNAFFDDINRDGGIFGRKLELQVSKIGSADELLQQGERLLSSEAVFATINAYTGRQDREFNQLTQSYHTPSIGPFTQSPATDEFANKYTFYLFGGRSEMTKSLLQFARQELQATENLIAHVYSSILDNNRKENQVAVAQAHKVKADIDLKARKYGLQFPLQEKVVESMKRDGVKAVVFSGTADQLLQLDRLSDQSNWHPYILLPDLSLLSATASTSQEFRERVYFASSIVSSGHSREGLTQFLQFHQRHNLGHNYIAAQVSAYTAASVMVEGLKRAGKQLSREKFLAALEGIQKLETGMVPPLSFGASHRVGISAAYILKIDPQSGRLKQATTWKRLD